MFFDWMFLCGTKFFYGIAVKKLLSTFIFKSVVLVKDNHSWNTGEMMTMI